MPDAFAPDLAAMRVHSRDPLNAEPRPDRLCAGFVTPARDFYVRCHGEIPMLDADAHRLRVGGRVQTPLDLRLATLRERVPRRSVTAVLQCAGNRRAELGQVRHVDGDPWGVGAIGNVEWSGVALRDVLHAAGADQDASLHVVLAGGDDCELSGERFRYAVSIPIAKALSAEVLLADAMNGTPLAPAHGFPLRAVVPGFAGVRSAKWLTNITVQDRPADTPVQARDYRLFPPDVTDSIADRDRGVPIDDMPLNAAICDPAEDAVVPAGRVTVRGYALATARQIVRVDVSADGGRHWRQADLSERPDAPWSWTLWRTSFDLPAGAHELVVRAWDSAGQTQPARPEEVWNFKGYLGAAWHRMRLSVR